MSRSTFAPESYDKDPLETRLVTFDFTNALSSGETISSIVGGAVTQSCDDPDSTALTISGSTVVSGNVKVTALVASGRDQCDYVLSCLVDTSANQRLILKGVIRIRSKL